jgi:DNA-binding transcriptional MerR regulator
LDKAPDAFRTISEVATDLDIPQHVLRFWETRFSQIRPMKRSGGRRYYRPDDVDLLRGIRHLLYGEGYTIRGVQRILREQGAKSVQSIGVSGAVPPVIAKSADERARPGGEPAFDEADEFDPVMEDDVSATSKIHLSDAVLPLGEPEFEKPARPKGQKSAAAGTMQGAGHASAAGQNGASAGLRRDDVRRLEATLHELVECRRLIDGAADAS